MMTLDEFSHEFDVLASSYLHEGGFTVSDSSLLAFNEYEKSVYLTREQENLVLQLYSDRSASGSFERTEELRRDLENLLCTAVLEPDETALKHIIGGSQFFKIEDDLHLWFIVYEAGRYAKDGDVDRNCPADGDGFPVEIVPVTYDTLHRIKGNPFRGPNARRALRLDNGRQDVSRVELLSKYKLGQYYVKYIRRPQPIILVNLRDGLTINGASDASGCELHDSLHRSILEAAVRAAVSSRVSQSGQQKQE